MKKIFSSGKFLGVVVLLFVVALFAPCVMNTQKVCADGGHTHCACGGNCTVINDTSAEGHEEAAEVHTCNTAQVWEEWDGSLAVLKNIAANSEKWYYISDSAADTITWTGQYTFAAGVKLHICLNGHTITRARASGSTSLKYFLVGYNGGTCQLDICDCQGTGHFAYKSGETHNDHSSFIQSYSVTSPATKITYNFYGGTVDQCTQCKNGGGAVTLNSVATFNMFGGVFNGDYIKTSATDATLTGTGGAFKVAYLGTLNMYGGTIQNGKANEGGNVFLDDMCTFNMYGGTIQDGEAKSHGGNVRIGCNTTESRQSLFSQFGGTISGGSANNGGNISITGGIYHLYNGVVTEGNATTSGGNIATEWRTTKCVGKIIMENGTISYGTATSGGNVGSTGNGMSFVMNDGLITGGVVTSTANTAYYTSETDCSSDKRGYGGNILVQGNGSFTMNGGTVSNGTCNASETGIACGGNIALFSWNTSTSSQLAGSVTINGGTIKNGKLTYDGTTPTKTKLYGANICIGGGVNGALDGKGTFNFNGGTVTNDLDTDENGVRKYGIFYSGTTDSLYPARGGNIYLSSAATVTVNATKANIEISNGYINSTMWAPGANIVIFGSATFAGTDTYTCVIKNGSGSEESVVDGGNIYQSTGGTVNFTKVTIEGGSCRSGGGNFTSENGTTNFTNCIISNGVSHYGGNIVTRQSGLSTMTLKDCTVSGGTATSSEGGNMYISGNTNLTIDNTTVSNGTSTTSKGGNIFVTSQTISGTEYKPTVLIKNKSIITGGIANKCGGNISAERTTSFTIEDSTISSGEAKCIKTTEESNGSMGGGNIYIGLYCTLNVTSGTQIIGGVSETKGGSIYVAQATSAKLNLTDSTVSGGLARTNTGGNIACTGIVTMTNSTIEDGTATGGGNVWVNISGSVDDTAEIYGRFVMNSGTIKNGHVRNSSGTYNVGNGCNVNVNGGYISNQWRYPGHFIMKGGSIILESGTFVGIDGETYQRSITSNGANVYNSGHFVMEAGTISGGTTTQRGGAVYLNSTSTNGTMTSGQQVWFKAQGGTISGGTATYGGNICVSSNSELVISGTTISGGTANKIGDAAGGYGGNIYSNGKLVIESGEISGGSATINGGNVRTHGGTATISGGTFQNGSVAETGEAQNAFFVSTTVSISGGTFLHNDDSETNVWVHSSCAEDDCTCQVTGGYFKGLVNTASSNCFKGGYYTLMPQAAIVADGYQVFTEENTSDVVTYHYVIDSSSNACTVTTTSNAKEGAFTYVASLQGGGIYRQGRSGTFTASTSSASNYSFVGWYLNGTKVSSDNPAQITVSSAESMELVAVYEYGGAAVGFKVSISSDEANFKVKTAGGTYGDSLDEFTAENVLCGTVYTVCYTGETPFVAWMNGNKKFMSQNEEYTFTVGSDVTLETLYTESTWTKKVVFLNTHYQILKTVEWIDGTSKLADVAPEIPYRAGKTAIGWYLGSQAATDQLIDNSTEKYISVCSKYSVDAETYTIHVKRATVSDSSFKDWSADSEDLITKTQTKANSAQLSVDETSGELQFICFKASQNGEVLSYDSSFIYHASEDVTIYAVYAENAITKEPTVTMTTAKVVNTNGATFEVTRSIPDGCTLIEQGVLLTADSLISENTLSSARTALTVDSEDCKKIVSSGTTADGITTLNIRKIGSGTIYVCGYVIYQKGDTIGIIYSKIAYGTTEGITIE